jgi:hypothetical protein
MNHSYCNLLEPLTHLLLQENACSLQGCSDYMETETFSFLRQAESEPQLLDYAYFQNSIVA